MGCYSEGWIGGARGVAIVESELECRCEGAYSADLLGKQPSY
jgi:hypothetical protein